MSVLATKEELKTVVNAFKKSLTEDSTLISEEYYEDYALLIVRGEHPKWYESHLKHIILPIQGHDDFSLKLKVSYVDAVYILRRKESADGQGA